MNALTMSVLLWYHINVKEYPYKSTTVEEAHTYLKRNGFIEQDIDGVWITTDKADCLIEHWCSTPFPVAVWKIPER